MSVQILIQGKLLGFDSFLAGSETEPDEAVGARALWLSLATEIIPRALLAELELASVLLGASGGGEFLLVLPDAVRESAEAFLDTAATQISAITHGALRLVWAVTENLGDWPVVRKRLAEDLQKKIAAPLATQRSFAPFQAPAPEESIFTPEFAEQLRTATSIGWDANLPSLFSVGGGKHRWSVSPNLSLDGITIPRHAARNGAESGPASAEELAHRATGQPTWGVLRGEVDLFPVRLRRLHSVEEHVQLSMLYKHFFAGELEALCLGKEFWQRITVLHSGMTDFAVYGSWDALILFAAEMQRTFRHFADEQLNDFPGAEAKTLTMAVALAESHDTLGRVFEEAGRNLAIAKASDKDCIYLFDRVVEWKQLEDAAELKDAVSRVSEEFRSAGRQFLTELTALYGKVSSATESQTDHEKLLRRAYRFQRRYNRAAFSKREKEFQKLRLHLVGEIMGRNIKPAAGKQLRFRPAGVVALEWARLSKEV